VVGVEGIRRPAIAGPPFLRWVKCKHHPSKIVEQKRNLLGRHGPEAGFTLQAHPEAMAQAGFEGFDGLAEAANASSEFSGQMRSGGQIDCAARIEPPFERETGSLGRDRKGFQPALQVPLLLAQTVQSSLGEMVSRSQPCEFDNFLVYGKLPIHFGFFVAGGLESNLKILVTEDDQHKDLFQGRRGSVKDRGRCFVFVPDRGCAPTKGEIG